MFSKNSKLAKRTYLALSLTTAMVAAYQPTYVSAAQEQSFGSKIVDAVEANKKDEVRTLLDKGINPNERGEFGTSALIRAVNNGNLEIAKILINKGANANVADMGGATPLHVAARKGDAALAQLLISSKANVNLADKEGNTPLMLAAIGGNQKIVEDLIANKADVDATNNSGETALLYATEKSSEHIVDMLVAAGAKKDVVDEEGYSIKEVAQRKNNSVLVAKLDAKDSNHVVIEMGRGFRSISAEEKQAQQVAAVPKRQSGEELIASLNKRNFPEYAVDYSAQTGNVDFIDDPELQIIGTPRFSQIEPAAGKSQQLASADTGKKSWLAGLKQSFETAGAFELASVKNFKEGSKYAILELGSFKIKAFAEKRISELQQDNMDVLGDVSLVIFERGTGANTEYLVNGGIFESRAEADSICQKLVARGVRCTPVETAMITNDQYAKFSAPVKSEYSAPSVEQVKIPELPKTDSAAAALPTLKAPPAAPTAPALPSLAQVKPVAPALPVKTPAELAAASNAANQANAAAKAASASVPPAPFAPAAAPALKPLAQVEAKPASPVIDAKSIAAANAQKAAAPIATTLPAAPLAPIQVKPEAPTVKTVALGNPAPESDDDVSLIARAGMKDDANADDAKKPESKSAISALVDSIYSEKEAATAKAPTRELKTPVLAEIPPVPKATISAEKFEDVRAVQKQIESLPSLPIADAKPVAAPAAPKAPMKIVFGDAAAPAIAQAPAAVPVPAKISSPSTNAPTIVASSDEGKIKVAEFRIDQPSGQKLANNSTVQPSLVNPAVNNAPALAPLTAPVPAPAPKQVVAPTPPPAPVKAPVKVVAETVAIPELPGAQPASLNAQPLASQPVDKFRVAKPIRVDDAFEAAPSVAQPAQGFVASTYSATPTVTYDNAYIAPPHTFNRKENRKMARVDYFATPTAAQGLYWKYREAGLLSPNITVRATKDILRGVHYSALIGEFTTSAEAQAFCNTVYKAEKLRCTVQAELDYTTAPRLTGVAKSYQRHSSNTVNVGGLSRHSSR